MSFPGEGRLHWYDWERYSYSQQERLKLGGLKGAITFAGEGPFMPYLRLGEQVNLGQGTTFGLGRYRTEFNRSLYVRIDS
ncbi:MAG TPA: hypothetical protein DCY27_09015 [Desulfobacterales bacterium]|nr:hypothetical protein [Desulfobacterales bacterium]